MMQESCTEFNVIAACNVDGKEQAFDGDEERLG